MQQFMTTSGYLGVGYQDQRLHGSGWLGAFMVGRLRFAVTGRAQGSN